MYTVQHVYLTTDAEGNAIVTSDVHQVADIALVPAIVAQMLTPPGGRAGTTIALTVSTTDPLQLRPL